jgi:hypothetical protein
MKPAQAAARSNPKPWRTPSACCTRSAVAGNAWSGVLVARMIASTSSGSASAWASAAREAAAPMKAQVSSGPATWRWRMPVRSAIQASLVSTSSASS